jgi:hypothetical protein
MANPARAIRFPDDLEAMIVAEMARTGESASAVVIRLLRGLGGATSHASPTPRPSAPARRIRIATPSGAPPRRLVGYSSVDGSEIWS